MKYALALLAILVFMATQSVGQALAPVQAEGGFWPFAIVAVVALVGVALYLWHRRNPSQADAAMHQALTTAKDETSALAHKVAEAMSTLTKTNREQAMVIASLPVQAAINAGPAPSAAPPVMPSLAPIANPTPVAQMGLESTIAPAEAPAPQPASDEAAGGRVLPPDIPEGFVSGWVTIPETGHVIPAAGPKCGPTMFVGYMQLVAEFLMPQLTRDEARQRVNSQLGAILMQQSYLPKQGGPPDFAYNADWWWNRSHFPLKPA